MKVYQVALTMECAEVKI